MSSKLKFWRNAFFSQSFCTILYSHQHEGSSFSISSPTLAIDYIYIFFNFIYPSECERISPCVFNLQLFIFWPHHKTCGILIFRPGIEPRSPVVKVLIPNHCRTARESLKLHLSNKEGMVLSIFSWAYVLCLYTLYIVHNCITSLDNCVVKYFAHF